MNTDERRAVLKFVNVKDMHICPCDDYESFLVIWNRG